MSQLPEPEPIFVPDGPLALSAPRRRMDDLVALVEARHPELADDPAWQTLAGLAQELASDGAANGAPPLYPTAKSAAGPPLSPIPASWGRDAG